MEHRHHLQKYQESSSSSSNAPALGDVQARLALPHIISLMERLTISLVKILVYERKIAVESEIQAVWDGRGEIVELHAVQKRPNAQLHHNVLTPI